MRSGRSRRQYRHATSPPAHRRSSRRAARRSIERGGARRRRHPRRGTGSSFRRDLALGLVLGVRFDGGMAGVAAFVLLAALWSLAFTGFGYAIALKTGNPAAVNSSFL